jgi:hypothetical protein
MYNEHEKAYSTFILTNEDSRWRKFAGTCLLVGVLQDRPMKQILEYIFECYHGLSIEEFTTGDTAIAEDMNLYFGKEGA